MYQFVVILFSISCNVVIFASNDLPVGHLLPLGGHRPAEAVEERYDFPSAEEFMEKYVRKSKHVVFRGAAKHFPAFKLWTEEYLKKKYPSVELRLEAKKEKEGYVPIGAAGVGRDTLENFINIYHQTNRYIVSELPSSMWNDVSVLPCMTCGMFKDRMVEVDIWMSGGDSSSIVHKDAFNTINCLLNGTKEWKFIAHKYESKIYKAWEPDEQVGGFSRINPEAVDLLKYPTIQEVPWSFSKLEAGDCVFLPGSMYHQVKSFGSMNVAVALLFSRFEMEGDNETHFEDCNNENQVFTPLSEFDVDWQYSGSGLMSMGNSELRQYKESIFSFLYKRHISKKRIKRHVAEVFANRNEQFKEQKFKIIYDALYKISNSVKVNYEDIMKLSKPALREIGIAMHPEEPSNTYDFEYSYVQGDSIINGIKELVKQNNGKLYKKHFIEKYQEHCHGTEKFARLIFKGLASGNEDVEVLTKDEIKKTIMNVTAPFTEDRSTDFYRDDERFSFGDAYETGGGDGKKKQPTLMTDEEWDNIGMPSEEENDDNSDDQKDEL